LSQSPTYSTDSDPKDADGKDEFIRRMLDRYERAVSADQENRLAAIDDLRFRSGVQWPANLQRAREDAERPVLTINEIPQFVRQVTGDILMNTPAIKVMPVDSGADKDLAEIFNGIIRNIEQRSHAKHVYADGGKQAVEGGFGAWRIVTKYEDDSFDQDIWLESIRNALAVVWDPLAMDFCRRDANYCFVHYRLPKKEFKLQYPDAMVVDFDVTGDDTDAVGLRNWFDGEGVRVAEYWCKEPHKKTIYQLRDGRVVDDTEGIEPIEIVRKREVDSHKVVQYIVSGKEVLEGPIPWAGKFIPIVHVPGEEVWVGENRVTHGVVRFLKDPQRLLNYMRSCSAEVVGQQPKMPWILTPGMIDGYEADWQNSGSSGKSVLIWNWNPEAPNLKPERSIAPVPATGLAAEAAMAAEDMHRVTGIYPASLGQQSREVSGKAIIAREKQGDTGTYVYQSMVAMAIAYTGEQLVDLIPKIYDTERQIRILGEDGKHQMVPVNKEVAINGPNGVQQTVKFDLSVGKYDVVVSTGPGFQTRSQEAAQGILDLIQAFPQSAPILADVVAEMQDWPNRDKTIERLQSLLPPNLQPQKMGPDGQPIPPPQPPPDPKMVEMQGKMQMAQQQQQLDAQNQQHQQQLEMASAEHKTQLMAVDMAAKRQLAEAEFDLKVWIAQQEVALEREKISAQIGLQAEQAARDAIVTGAKTDHSMQMEERDQQHSQSLEIDAHQHGQSLAEDAQSHSQTLAEKQAEAAAEAAKAKASQQPAK
jgi:hypothetical protein